MTCKKCFYIRLFPRLIDYSEVRVCSKSLSLGNWSLAILSVGQEYRPSYYATVVAFIQRQSNVSSASIARPRLEDMLTCNIT